MTKVCSRCKEDKQLSDFNKKSKDSFQSQCRACQKETRHEFYIQNKAKYVDKTSEFKELRRRINYKYIKSYLESHPCIDCGNKDIQVLEFDHIRDKLKAISYGVANWSLVKLKEEIDKCVVRCANCHRKKTQKQLGFARSEW